MRSLISCVSCCLLIACGGSEKSAKSADSEDRAPDRSSEGDESGDGAEANEESEEAAGGFPTECASSGDVCVPPRKWVERLCQDVYPDVALAMFRGGTPWTRGYLTRRTEAWNASGGASISGWLEFDEEVIILRARKAPTGGMQVSGAGGGYEAIRWNGACVTLSGEEVTMNEPPRPKRAKVEFRFLEDAVQEALRTDETVNQAYRDRRKECKGATMGAVSKKCVKLDQKLSDVIVEFVSGGGDVGVPEKLP